MFNTATRKRPNNAARASAKRGASMSLSAANDASKSRIRERKSSTPPTTLEIDGVEVHFPFRPYDVQRDYMKGVLTALHNSQHALLESPTGTGKTLCLLCSALAWQREEKGRIAQRSSDDVVGLSQHPNLTPGQGEGSQTLEGAAPTRNPNSPPVIIYASRTHSQLAQVVGELRNTRYRPRHAVLGSREHMCIHPKVNPIVAKGKGNIPEGDKKSSTEVNNGCSKLCKERKCMYRNTLEDRAGKGGVWNPPSNEKVAAGGEYEQPVLDIEEIVTVGKEHKICPFYHSRSLLKDADLIFVPYNYLFDRDAREMTLADVDFKNAVLIFDEAHNLEEFASESSSFDLSTSDVAGCVFEVTRALQYLELSPEMAEEAGMRDNMLRLKSILLKFEKYLTEDVGKVRTGSMQRKSTEGEASHPGEFIFDIFKEGAGITHDNLRLFHDFVRRVSDVITEFKGNTSSSGTPKLDHFLACLKRAFGSGTELLAIARAKSYRVHVTKMSDAGSGGFSGGRTVSYWCFAPALAMRELSFLGVRSILITSGTLSPLPSFSMELGLDFPVQLENDHVIQSDQIFVRVVGKGVSGKELSSKFGRRDDPEYISELGSTLASLCRNIPGGVLVFFPSYGAMQTAVDRWGGPSSDRYGGRQSGGGKGAAFFAARRKKKASAKYVFPMVPPSFRSATGESSPWQRLLARKAIVLEPRSTSELADAISEFKKFIAKPKSAGAILMGVCRGKISEGIDFADDMCRAVVVTGLPFAPYLDPKVKLKREYLDAARASAKTRPSIDGGFGNGKLPTRAEGQVASKTLSGAEWYNQQAHRAVNQAVGRVIRHRHDYGAVLLLDHRFAEARNRDGLSKWLRPHLRNESFGLTNRGLIHFYKESKARAEKAKASLTREKEPIQLKYEEPVEPEGITKLVAIKPKERALANDDKADIEDDDPLLNGYVKPDRVIKRFDLNRSGVLSPTRNAGEDASLYDDSPASNEKLPKDGLGALYSRGRAKSEPNPTSVPSVHEKASSFGNIETKSTSRGPTKLVKKGPIDHRPQLARKNNAATSRARAFFETAQSIYSRDEIQRVQKLLVLMKSHGDSKNGPQYMKAAKDLISVLVESHVDSRRIQLIGSLFPLLPMKYRYQIEKMAAKLTFEKSSLQSRCKDSLPEKEFISIRSFVLPIIFDQSESFADRTFLQDSQRILMALMENNIDTQNLFDLLPGRLIRKVKALAIEMKKSKEMAKAKERSLNFRGEGCVNTALFRRAEPAPRIIHSSDVSDVDSQKDMTSAISQAAAVNRQKKNRVLDFQRNKTLNRKPLNPYRRPALKDSTKRNLPAAASGKSLPDSSKRVCKGASSASRQSTSRALDGMDAVDKCLHQVNSDGFVRRKTKLERINGKINAHVPKGMVCVICSETPKEPLMAECHHTACHDCWKLWLKRQSNCPVCRKATEMKDLAKLIFAKDVGTRVPSLTQICASGDEEGSDDDELEVIIS